MPLCTIRRIMKKSLGYRYRKVTYAQPHYNTEVNILMRKHFAKLLIDLFDDGYHQVHLDESHFQYETYADKGWIKKGQTSVGYRKRLASTTLVSAVSTCGKTWSMIFIGTNDNLSWRTIVTMFVLRLRSDLYYFDRRWITTFDSAGCHTEM